MRLWLEGTRVFHSLTAWVVQWWIKPRNGQREPRAAAIRRKQEMQSIDSREDETVVRSDAQVACLVEQVGRSNGREVVRVSTGLCRACDPSHRHVFSARSRCGQR